MSNYPVPPPSYGSADRSPRRSGRDDAGDPLLGASGSSGYYDQPEVGDLPDDFKYGTTVSESAPEIRHAFIRKVYTILFGQILLTTIVAGALMGSPNAVIYVQTHTWAFWVPLIATFINLGLLFWKRHSHPWNFVLLSTFTLLEAFSVGNIVAFFDEKVVLQALIITLAVFLGLTLFTLQSKYEFEGLGPWLFGALIAFCVAGIMQLVFPFSKTVDLVYAIIGTLIFSGYIVYDTYLINKRLSPDEFIIGALSLYLDFINLFLSILRLLNNVEDR